MERRCREHVYMYLELFLITAGRNEMGRPLPLAIPCSLLCVLGRARQRGVAEGCRGEGERLRRRPRPCPGSAGRQPGLRGGAGRWRCLARCQRLLRSFTALLPHGRHFKVLSAVAAPCGAVPSLQLGLYFCVLAGKRSCLGLWEPLPEILKALLPSGTPHSCPSPGSPSWGAVKRAWLTRAHARSFNPANIPSKLAFLPLKIVIQRIGIKKSFERTSSERWPKNKTWY